MTLTKRGKRVRALAILLGFWLLWTVSTQIWWVGTGAPTADFLGWCYGDVVECMLP
jgi:hypothetical protein